MSMKCPRHVPAKNKDASFNLNVVEIPGASNRRYIGLIYYNDAVPVRFGVGECLKVNFDATIDKWEENWSGMVIELLPFAGFKKTCIVLHRLRKKYSEGSDDLKLVAIIKTTFTDDSSIQMACE